MKSKPFACLAASLLSAAIAAQAGSNTFGVLFCSATVNVNTEAELAVELPATPGYTDINGDSVAIWKVGTVAAGGAIDTFYSENGPGAFQVRNTGNRNAFIYITTGILSWLDSHKDSTPHSAAYYEESLTEMFGSPIGWRPHPDPSKRGQYDWDYSLAVSTGVTGKVPVWRNLEWCFESGTYTDTSGNGESATGALVSNWVNGRGVDGVGGTICGQYLGYLAAGEVQPFDLKFYAPYARIDGSGCYDCGFIVRLEASTFRRWDHDK